MAVTGVKALAAVLAVSVVLATACVVATAALTTDKDAVRFESLGELPFALYRVPLHVEFDPADALFGSITAVLRAPSAHSSELRRAR